MGFFKFLKRGKKESLDDLDLPPLPPLKNSHGNLDIDADFGQELPDFPEFPDLDKELGADSNGELPKLDFPEHDELSWTPQKYGQKPSFGNLPQSDDEPVTDDNAAEDQDLTSYSIPTPVQESKQEIAEPELKLPLAGSYPKSSGRLFSQEKKALRDSPAGKTIYLKVDDFKAMLGTITIVRNDLKKTEGYLSKLENLKSAKDSSFDKVKLSLDDLQKKLIFIDKTLFKGE